MSKLLWLAAVVAALIGSAMVFIEPSRPLRLHATRPLPADLVATLNTNGRIEAGERYEVVAQAGGVVGRVVVEPGSTVAREQLLMEIDNRQAPESVEAAEARLDAVRADLVALRDRLEPAERAELEARIDDLDSALASLQSQAARAERLLARSAVAQVEVEEIRRKISDAERQREVVVGKLRIETSAPRLEAARARVREAESALASAHRQAASARIVAPIDGVVYSITAGLGQFVSAGTPVATIAGSQAPTALIYVDEPDLGRIALGADATLSADAFPGESWSCRIDRLPTEVVEVGPRRVGQARCKVAARDGATLIPNLTVDVSIVTARTSAGLSLPHQAVARSGSEDAVWVYVDGAAQRRTVRSGVGGLDRVEILEGLDPSDLVLILAGETLAAGDPVELMQMSKETR